MDLHEYVCFAISLQDLTPDKYRSQRVQAKDPADALEKSANHIPLKEGEQIAVVMAHV